MRKVFNAKDNYVLFIGGPLALILLYILSRYNYLLFHTIAEVFSITIASCMFFIAWHSRTFSENNYLKFIGIAYLFIGVLDFFHTLSYRGMGVFPGYGSNAATQLWIAGRYMESISLFLAPIFLRRNPRMIPWLGIYGILTSFVLLSVFYWGNFPICFIEGSGLTLFKVTSEYVISIVLLGTIGILVTKKDRFDKNVLNLVIVSIVLTIFSELAFTLYTDVYGVSNLVGHCLKIASFYVIYRAVIVTSLEKPYNILFRDLQKREVQYRGIVEDQTELIYRWLPDRTLTFVNNAFCRFAGKSKDALIGNTYQPVMLEGDRGKVENKLHSLDASGTNVTYEYRVVFPKGEIHWLQWTTRAFFDEHGTIIEYQSVGWDITDQKRLEQIEKEAIAIDASAKTARDTIEAMNDGVILFNINGYITTVNPAFEKLTGYEKNELIGENVKRILPKMVKEENLKTSLESLKVLFSGNVPSNLSSILVSKSGKEIPVLYAASFIKDSSNQPTSLVITIKDMTEAKRIEEQLRQAKAMDMLGKLSLGVAHEVRNPLNSITAISEALFKEIGENPEYQPYLEHIRNQVNRLSTLMKDLLDYGRPVQLTDLKPVYIGKIVEDVVKDWKETSHCHPCAVKVIKAPGTGICQVKADVAKMQQVFINLIENACNHSPECCDLTINLLKEDEQVLVKVKDNGTGIPSELIMYAFEPFFTTRKKGTGLGLSIVKNIIEFHSGTISLYNNEPFPGITVELRLPLYESERAEIVSAT